MFGLFKKQSSEEAAVSGATLTELSFQIDGMHCTSCALNIDADLEDLPGVKLARTNYAKSQTVVKFDPVQVRPEQIKASITKAGYRV